MKLGKINIIMTPKQALEESIILWTWLSSEDNRKSKNDCETINVRDYMHNCPLCQYVYNTYNIDPIGHSQCVRCCPMKNIWTNGCQRRGYGKLTNKTSYEEWYLKPCKETAQKVLNELKQALSELNKVN